MPSNERKHSHVHTISNIFKSDCDNDVLCAIILSLMCLIIIIIIIIIILIMISNLFLAQVHSVLLQLDSSVSYQPTNI